MRRDSARRRGGSTRGLTRAESYPSVSDGRAESYPSDNPSSDGRAESYPSDNPSSDGCAESYPSDNPSSDGCAESYPTVVSVPHELVSVCVLVFSDIYNIH